MKRPSLPLGLLCILTLPIFVVASFEAVFSFFVADYWSYFPPDFVVLRSLSISRALVEYTHALGKHYYDDGRRGWEHEFGSARHSMWVERSSTFTTGVTFLGFAYLDNPQTGFRVIVIPLWPIIVLSAIPTAVWIRRRRSPTRLPGHCPICGYDLRASNDRCPECGTTIPATEPKIPEAS